MYLYIYRYQDNDNEGQAGIRRRMVTVNDGQGEQQGMELKWQESS